MTAITLRKLIRSPDDDAHEAAALEAFKVFIEKLQHFMVSSPDLHYDNDGTVL